MVLAINWSSISVAGGLGRPYTVVALVFSSPLFCYLEGKVKILLCLSVIFHPYTLHIPSSRSLFPTEPIYKPLCNCHPLSRGTVEGAWLCCTSAWCITDYSVAAPPQSKQTYKMLGNNKEKSTVTEECLGGGQGKVFRVPYWNRISNKVMKLVTATVRPVIIHFCTLCLLSHEVLNWN